MNARHAMLLMACVAGLNVTMGLGASMWLGPVEVLVALVVLVLGPVGGRLRRVGVALVLAVVAVWVMAVHGADMLAHGGIWWLVVYCTATAHRRAQQQSVVLLCVLQGVLLTDVLAATASHHMLAALIVLTPWTLAHIEQPNLRMGFVGSGLAVISLACAAWWLPPDAAEAPPQQNIGFRKDVSLGSLGPLHDDPTPLAEVQWMGAPPEDIYLRGMVLDRFTGNGWRSTAPELQLNVAASQGDNPVTQRIVLQPLTGGVLLAAAPIAAIELQGEGETWRDPLDTWWHTRPLESVVYTVTTETAPVHRAVRGDVWLNLPTALDPDIRMLAATLAQQAPSGRGESIAHTVQWLTDNLHYTRVPHDEHIHQSLSTFLFESRTGHCEYFATALAVLLRLQGISSRVVTGVRGGERTGEGQWLFRQQDAHAWVEVREDDGTWRVVDATPFNGRQVEQAQAVATSGENTPPTHTAVWAIALAAFGVVGGGLWWRRQHNDPLLRRYHRARRLVARRGWKIPSALPPQAAGAWLVAAAGESGRPLARLAELLYLSRYGGQPASDVLKDADSALAMLGQLPHFRQVEH